MRALHSDDCTRDAAVKVLWTRFDDMWAQCGAVLDDFDVDAVHDLRVSSRRLRTAMQTFRPCFARRSYREHANRIKVLADLLGEVRDRDVLLEELKGDRASLPPDERAGLDGLIEGLRLERKTHREALKSQIEQWDATAYDRDFLSYLARSV